MNKLLVTTALVALSCATGVNAAETNISTDTTLQENYTEDLIISGGTNTADNLMINIGNPSDEKNLTISGGNTTLTDSSLNSWAGTINMSDGVINLGEGEDTGLWAAKGINISGGTINMNGSDTYMDTFYDLLDEHGDPLPKPATPGDITISGGTINVNGANASISTEGSIDISNATINVAEGSTLSSFSSFTLDGDMQDEDKGTLNLNDGSNLNLSGTLAANVGSADDKGNVNFKTSSAVVDGDFADANLNFDTSHSLSNAITGTVGDINNLNINGGTFTFDKEPTGTITTVNVKSGAILDIGDKTLVSSGDTAGEGVKFADNSTLAFTITDKNTYGKIKADLIDISTTGTNLNMTLNSAALAKDETATFKILDSTGITGAFANLSENARYTFVDNGDGTFDVTGEASATDVVADAGGTANNAATAAAWDSVSTSGTSNPTTSAVATTLAQLSNSTDAADQQAYVDALTALAPEVVGLVQTNSTETTNQIFGAVGTRLSGGSVSSSREGMASGDSMFDKAAMWIQGLFNHAKLDDTSKAHGFDSDTAGVAMGVEKHIDSATKVGVGYAFNHSDINGFNRDTDVDTHTAIVYGEYKPSKWFVNGVATYGWSKYDETRNVAGVNVGADYDAEVFGLQAMTGYDFNVGGTVLTPETGLRYMNIKQKSYTDDAGQRVGENTSDILTGVIGAKVSKEFALDNGWNLKPEARVAATYDLNDEDSSSVITLANGSGYTVKNESLDRFGMEVGLGLTADVNDKVELSVGYEGRFREDYQDHTGLIGAKYKF